MFEIHPSLSLADQFQAAAHGSTVSLPDDLGLLRVQGADAASFLHTQLTNAVTGLQPNELRLAGYCSPKGRLLASMWLWGNDEDVWLLLSKDILPALQKRLSMFVLRAKAKISDESAQIMPVGLSGAGAAQAMTALFDVPAEPMRVAHHAEYGTLLRLADGAGQVRYLWCAPVAVENKLLPQLAVQLSPVAPAVWQWLEVQSAVPRITLATQEQFVPQMVNFEALGGVNFKKGCYPGQEIVARSQYRGTIKRRMQLAHTTAPAQAGQEIFHSADPSQPCGMVVLAAPTDQGGESSAVLVECKLDALESGSLHLGCAEGATLTIQALPYDLPTEQ